MPVTTAFWRNRLPHWEVREGVYFLTLRCAGSLPPSVVGQVAAIREAGRMKDLWARWKGRTARRCNEWLGRTGAFWHKDWFDRWMRNDAATERTVRYIRNNPVKAGLVKDWREYEWVR